VFIGPHASAAEREGQARLIEHDPTQFIAQELVHLSTAPTETRGGQLAPRHVDLRPFAVFGEEIRIVPGGLTRVALREGSMIVNSSQGGGSKDTWVLDDGDAVDPSPGTLPLQRPPRLPDVRYGGGWHSQSQQQQQQKTWTPRDRPLGDLAGESAPAD
jgi:Circularly permuted ATP-grasp type 2